MPLLALRTQPQRESLGLFRGRSVPPGSIRSIQVARIARAPDAASRWAHTRFWPAGIGAWIGAAPKTRHTPIWRVDFSGGAVAWGDQ